MGLLDNISFKDVAKETLKNIGRSVLDTVPEVLSDSDFISRTIGMQNSYNDIMFILQTLGREPISLLGKDYPFIYDHVRRNYMQGTYVMNNEYNCPKFTFYKSAPTIRFADPYTDPEFLIDRWFPDTEFETTHIVNTNKFYSESNDGRINNKKIVAGGKHENIGTRTFGVESYGPEVNTCDIIKKTNENFIKGKYETLIARFHTNSTDSRDPNNPTQTAISEKYGMSHGRNLLKIKPTDENGYDNPYCRVWTYHHQYHTLEDTIRPFEYTTAKELERAMNGSGEDGKNISFRTKGEDSPLDSENFEGGSSRLDKHGVLNYETNMVNIAPTAKIIDYFKDKVDEDNTDRLSIKKCMFSIENLAWRDTNNSRMNEFEPNGLSAEQKGPLGGRIMWFPPYNISFSEAVTVNWNRNDFIGRGESIYTYTNTERRGSLSFTLLIDHPSIVDYWDRKSGKNDFDPQDADSMGKSTTNSVDDKSSDEQTLLRFFAGCDILQAKPQTYEFNPNPKKPEKDENDPPKVETPIKTPQSSNENNPKNKVLYCLLYYPNNYSGVDDAPNSNSTVNAVDYLMNGIGTQKVVDGNDMPVDLSVDKRNNVNVYIGDREDEGYGGYEVRKNKGISVVTRVLEQKYDIIKKTFADTVSTARKAQYLTDSGGTIVYAGYGSEYELAKQVGSEAASMGSASGRYTGGVSKSVAVPPFTWYWRRWYYRVDKSTENQKLLLTDDVSIGQNNYIDNWSYEYNGNGYDSKLEFLKHNFGINYDDDNNDLIAFTDLYVGCENDSKVADVLGGCYDSSRVKTFVRPFFENKDNIKISKITFQGHASSQGRNASEEVNEKRNDTLARNRAETFRAWLASKGFPGMDDSSKVEVTVKNIEVEDGGNMNDASNPITKLWRSAAVIIEYNDEEITNAAVSTGESKDVDENGNPDTVRTDIKSNETSKINPIALAIYNEGSKAPNFQNIVFDNHMNILQRNMQDEARRLNDQMMKEAKDRANEMMNNNIKNTEPITLPVERYDNEGEFFELLKKNDPFLHHLISEKVKYFDPAFHSITPEGFNSRLTFLHQCTRQGSTVENSAFQSGTAYNLAFGRPPVCVLRLGDFYYTKILINSLNITYEDVQWDLNPEGIGVMPMFANVSIDFTFIGGSDLAGPIARLQNAVSFNYYANTSVYDNRAEMVEYDSNKSGKETKFKGYVYPSTPNDGPIVAGESNKDIK